MGAKTSTEMQTELARRVTQISTGAGSAALEAINRALRWVNRQGSYTFQLVGAPVVLSVTTSATIAAPADLDAGKAMFLVNATNGIGLPINKSGLTDLWETRNFTIEHDDAGFDRYLLVSQPNPPSTFYFSPAQSGTCDVSIRYHKLTADLADGSVYSNLPRDFDDIIVDLAESEERRINDIGETWQITLARCQDQIKLMLSAYESKHVIQGPATQDAEAVQQKTTVGRA